MTIALWCILAAAIVPYLFIGIAKASGEFVRGNYNKNPRVYAAQLSGFRQRAHWAHQNGFEAFPPFAAAVIVAHMLGAPQGTADTLALVFVGARIVHGALYVADQGMLRSLAWAVGVGSVIGLFVISA